MTVSLLPPAQQPRIASLAQPLTEATLAAHHAVVVLVNTERASKVLGQLPYGSMWQQLHAQAGEKPTHFVARAPNMRPNC